MFLKIFFFIFYLNLVIIFIQVIQIKNFFISIA